MGTWARALAVTAAGVLAWVLVAVLGAPPPVAAVTRYGPWTTRTAASEPIFSAPATWAVPTARPTNEAAAFTSKDVGFSEGAAIFDPDHPAELTDRLDGMTRFLPGTQALLRVDLNWWYVQDCRTCTLRWDRIDPVVDAARARGTRVLVILDYAPPWANGGHSDDKWFPTDDAAWRSIVARTVAHFGDKVVAYEVWNEPNNVGTFSNYASDPKARYWQLVKIASAAVRANCSSCLVLAGGSGTGTTEADDSATWLEYGYAAGAAAAFDAVTHHPYPAWSAGYGPARPECARPAWNMFGPPSENPACGGLARVHAVMVKHQDTEKKIWGTEWGYPTSGATGLPLTTIRDYMVQGVSMWRALPYTGPLFLFSYRDSCTNQADPECAYGVVTTTGTAKEPLTSDLSAALRSPVPLCTGGSSTGAALESLEPGTCLGRGRGLTSLDRRFQLWLQDDGNLVLYRFDGAVALWATNTRDGVRLENRFDGDLVLVRADGTTAWHSGTTGNGLSALRLQDDGNLVLYRADDAYPTWATGTVT